MPAYVVFTDNTLDRDRRDAARRRRRAGRDPRHRRPQARAVRPRRARPGRGSVSVTKPPSFAKIVPKPQVRKSLVGFGVSV